MKNGSNVLSPMKIKLFHLEPLWKTTPPTQSVGSRKQRAINQKFPLETSTNAHWSSQQEGGGFLQGYKWRSAAPPLVFLLWTPTPARPVFVQNVVRVLAHVIRSWIFSLLSSLKYVFVFNWTEPNYSFGNSPQGILTAVQRLAPRTWLPHGTKKPRARN